MGWIQKRGKDRATVELTDTWATLGGYCSNIEASVDHVTVNRRENEKPQVTRVSEGPAPGENSGSHVWKSWTFSEPHTHVNCSVAVEEFSCEMWFASRSLFKSRCVVPIWAWIASRQHSSGKSRSSVLVLTGFRSVFGTKPGLHRGSSGVDQVKVTAAAKRVILGTLLMFWLYLREVKLER